MKKAKAVLNVVDFENHLGQTIKPGDEVVIVTTGYSHRVSISKGAYLGRKGINNGASCRVTEHRTKYRFKSTGEEVDHWWTDASQRGLLPTRPTHPGYPTRPSGWNYSSPEFVEYNAKVRDIQAEYARLLNAYQATYKKVKDDNYEDFRVPYYRHTTLQRNRIYKLDTSVFDLEL